MKTKNNFFSKFPQEEQKYLKCSLVGLVPALLATVVGLIFLPDMIFVQILSERPDPETKKLFFLLAMMFVSALSCFMCFFTEKRKKWLALEIVLVLAEIALVVYNLIVL